MDGYYKRIAVLKNLCWKEKYSGKISFPQGQIYKEIHIKGRLLGGCLDYLLNLVGTRFDKTKEFVEKYREDGILCSWKAMILIVQL